MLTLEKCRKINPALSNLSDKELLRVRDELYTLGEIAMDDYLKKIRQSKFSHKLTSQLQPERGRGNMSLHPLNAGSDRAD